MDLTPREEDEILLFGNDWQPRIELDPQTDEVWGDGQLLIREPAKVLPMPQRYFLL